MHVSVNARARQSSTFVRLAAFLSFVLLAVTATSLSAQQTSVITGRVTDSQSGQPVAGARVSLPGTLQGTVSRTDGTFRLAVTPGRHPLLVSYLGYSPHRDTVEIASGETTNRDYALVKGLVQLDPSVVLGTRSAQRTVLNSPVPVDVLTPIEIRQTGAVETSQIIQLLAPSFNFPRPTVADGTDHIRPSTLRGLGPDQVLVLLNGKRRHTTALVNVNGSIGRGSTGVDLNAIPTAAIERIEVLRDGAAAQYGSDAIAGVINIILKSDAPGEFSSTLGQTKEGDGMVTQADVSYGLLRSATGFLNLTAEYRDREQTNRSRPDTRQQYFTGDPRNDDPALTNRINHRQGDGDARDMGAFVNFGRTLASGMELYAFSGVTFRRGEAAGFFRRPLDDRTVRAIYPNGFLPLINTHIMDGSLAAGVRGDVAGWNWDVSGNYGRNTFDFNIKNTVNVSLGADSPTEFEAGSLKFDQLTVNVDFVRPFEIGMYSPLSVAVGAEGRRDGYGITAGEPDSYRDGGVDILDGPNAGNQPQIGSQVFPGFKPSDEQTAARNAFAGYVDVEVNLHPMFLVNAAARTEHYDDFGGTTNGKLAMRFEPLPRFALRGAVSTGFRAPSLGQSYFSSTATNFIVIGGVSTPFDIRTFPVGSEEAQILGARELQPEKSRNYSAGLAWQPINRVSLTADYYHIEIDDRIVLSGNFIGDDIQQLLEERGFSGVRGGRFFTNAVDTKTDGVDVIFQTAFDVANLGLSRFTVGYNHNKSEVTRVAPTPPQLGNRQETLFDRVERARIEEGQPRDNLHIALNHTSGPLGINLATARYGEVTSRGVAVTAPATPADQTFSAKWITDIGLSYGFTRGFTLMVGADNVFDVYPDENIAPASNSGIFPYNQISPFGFNGAYYYVRGRIALP